MSKKWISMLLAVMMLLGLAVPAFAEGEQEAPPTAEIVEEAPQAEEAPPASDETAPAEDAIVEETVVEEAPAEEVTNDDGIMPISDEPMAVAAGGVTLNITGPTDGIDWYVWHGTDGKEYETSKGGTSYSYLETPSSISYTQVWIEKTDHLQTQVTVKPGDEMWVFISPDYNITVDNGTITSNEVFGYDGRRVDVKCPDSGTVTLHIVPTEGYVPEIVPLTFYNWDEAHGVVGGLSPDDGYYALNAGDETVITGGYFEIWMAPGYEIQVLEGGSITRTKSPSGPAANSVPAGTVSYELYVDLGAEKLVIAAVKQGESFQAPDTNAPQAETPPQTDGTFSDVTSGVWYEDTVMSAYEKGIVKGVTENTFSPNSTTTRGQTVTMLYRAMGSPGGANVFSDTSGEVGSAAGWASASGVTNGVSTTAFAPNSSITREQLVTMLYRMAGSPAADTSKLASFTDGGSVQSYAQSAVAWAISNGLLTGYGDGTIRPAGVATRAEVCTIIMRYLG